MGPGLNVRTLPAQRRTRVAGHRPPELRRLRGIALVLPFAFLVGYSYLIRGPAYGPFHTPAGFIATMAVVGLMVLGFTSWVFRTIGRQQRLILRQNDELRRMGNHLRALNTGALAIASETGPATALRKIVDVSRSLFHARRAGLVIVEQGEVRDLITASVDPDDAAPRQLAPGLLDRILAAERPLRLDEDEGAPGGQAAGTSASRLLVTPLHYQGELLGALYLADRVDGRDFDEQDEELLGDFAVQVAIALHAVRLYLEVQTLATETERQWIAREMHDGVAQVLAYVNVKAQAISEFLTTGQAEQAQDHLQQLAEAARRVYADVREGILGLRLQLGAEERSLALVVQEYVREFEVDSGLDVTLTLECPQGCSALDPLQEVQVLRIIQEALTNVRKHANARRVQVRLGCSEQGFHARVRDDGVGFDAARSRRPGRPCFGLQTMQERAESVGGLLSIDSTPGAGTEVSVTVPSRAAVEVVR